MATADTIVALWGGPHSLGRQLIQSENDLIPLLSTVPHNKVTILMLSRTKEYNGTPRRRLRAEEVSCEDENRR